MSAAREITRGLRGVWHGTYGSARCPAHDDRNPSLSIFEHGGRTHVKCHAGCDQGAVIAALREQGLWADDRRNLTPRHSGRVPAIGDDAERRSALARKVWRETRPLEDTPAERYLAGRGLRRPYPPTIRYHAACRHGPSRRDHPAMIGAISTAPGRRIVAVHRTFLTLDGARADVEPVKMALGPSAGGAVRLGAADAEVVLCEGIETGLALAQATTIPVWACLSTSGLRAVRLSPSIREVIIAADGDAPGRAAAQITAQRLIGEGRRARIADPGDGRDFNDLGRARWAA